MAIEIKDVLELIKNTEVYQTLFQKIMQNLNLEQIHIILKLGTLKPLVDECEDLTAKFNRFNFFKNTYKNMKIDGTNYDFKPRPDSIERDFNTISALAQDFEARIMSDGNLIKFPNGAEVGAFDAYNSARNIFGGNGVGVFNSGCD